jgi:hypothetical protein
MSDFKIIYVTWTKPFFNKNNFTGIKSYLKDGSQAPLEYKLEDYEKLMQIYSFTSAKRHTGAPIKMYTDTAGYEYYRKENMLQYFDEVDVDFLNSVNADSSIDPAKFWTSGKILSICNEKPPFLFLDTDFFLLNKIPDWVFKKDVTHAHWELLRAWLYVAEGRVKDEFGLNIPEFSETMLIPNTCFLFMNDNELVKSLQERYRELHLEIVRKNYQYVPDELWLMTDQNILGYLLRARNANVGHAINKIYIQFADNLGSTAVGNTPRWTHFDNIERQLPEVKYHHVWFEKTHLHQNSEYKENIMKDWQARIDENLKALSL